MLEIYTDGAYSSKRKLGGWAFIVTENNQEIYSKSGFLENSTNNICELTAILEAIKYTSTNEEIFIYTDSEYAIGSISKGWKRNKNIELLKEIDNILINKKVKFKHVKGHSDNEWNNKCDKLAVEQTKIK